MNYFKLHIFSFLALTITFCAESQSEFEFEQLIGDNVTTQSITYAIEQDSIGNLWIASEEGVMKYNSDVIKVYNTYNGLPETVSNRTNTLLIDSKQRIWIGHENGIGVYDENLDEFALVESNIDINPSLINTIIEDDNGIIWACGYNGLWKFNSKTSKLERIVNNHIIQTLYCYRNKIYFGTAKGLFIYNKESDIITEIKNEFPHKYIWFIGEANNKLYAGTKTGEIYTINTEQNTCNLLRLKKKITHPIRDIIDDDLSNLYIAVDGEGLYYLNKDYKIINHYKQDVDNPSSLSSNGIYDIELGKENILWIATYGGGINYYDFNKSPFQRIKHIVNNENTIATDFSRSIAKDKNGNIWFGTTKGISVWNPKKNSWKQIPKLSKSSDNEHDIVLALEPDGDFIWAGTYTNGLFKININNYKSIHYSRDRNKKIDVLKIYTVCKDSRNNIWFAGIEGSLNVLRPNENVDNYPIYQIKSIIESSNGQIIVAGKNGVYQIEDSKKEFKLFEKTQPNKYNLAYSSIDAIEENSDKVLILATNGAGIVFYNPKTDNHVTFSKRFEPKK